MGRVRNYIGLSCSGHDNAIAIVGADGDVRFAEATERPLQCKRSLGLPADGAPGLSSLLERHLDAGAEVVVAKSWSEAFPGHAQRQMRRLDHHLDRLRGQASCPTAELGGHADFYLRRLASQRHLYAVGAGVWAASGLAAAHALGQRVVDVRHFDHHLTHAAFACMSSPFADAACAVIDGLGEGGSVSLYRYDGTRLTRIGPDPTHDGDLAGSLGLFYADLCSLCGFDHWKGEEWKVMGLAPYGKPDPVLSRHLRACLEIDGLSLRRSRREPLALARLWAHRRQAGQPVLAAADLAQAGQGVFEEIVLALCKRLHEWLPSDNLVLTGGCALNSAANGKLIGGTPFRRLFVPSAPADDGNAVGAALLAFQQDHPDHRHRSHWQTPYLGSEMSQEALHCAELSGAGHERLSDGALYRRIAHELAQGRIVGWVQGRAEFGPRALGNRSILADPRDPHMKARLNDAVKYREGYRPFAPAVLAELGPNLFENYEESPYMERTLRWREQAAGQVPAVVHEDGTGRAQSVRREWNPAFHGLLDAFREETGVPVLLNTSLNVMGRPIAHSVEDVVGLYGTSGLDVLVVGSTVWSKRSPGRR